MPIAAAANMGFISMPKNGKQYAPYTPEQFIPESLRLHIHARLSLFVFSLLLSH